MPHEFRGAALLPGSPRGFVEPLPLARRSVRLPWAHQRGRSPEARGPARTVTTPWCNRDFSGLCAVSSLLRGAVAASELQDAQQ